MDKPAYNPDEAPLSIGGLSRATGIAVETLRTWERRYGFPQPVRTPSGHRRYTLATAERLRLVQEAVKMGHRASAVLACGTEQLEALLDVGGPPTPRTPAPPAEPTTDGDVLPSAQGTGGRVKRWLALVERFDGTQLDREMEMAWQEFGARVFVLDLALDVLREIGERWSNGEISIAHEHFASERLRDFLSRQWRPLSNQGGGPQVVCAALSGEHHTLPLHLSAVLLALEGVRPVILGADTPEEEVARAGRAFGADAVLVGASAAADHERVCQQLRALRARLPASIPIVVGGAVGPVPEGVERLTRLDALTTWAHALSGAQER